MCPAGLALLYQTRASEHAGRPPVCQLPWSPPPHAVNLDRQDSTPILWPRRQTKESDTNNNNKTYTYQAPTMHQAAKRHRGPSSVPSPATRPTSHAGSTAPGPTPEESSAGQVPACYGATGGCWDTAHLHPMFSSKVTAPGVLTRVQFHLRVTARTLCLATS